MTTAAQFQAKVTKSVTNMDRLDVFVNGDDTETVDTDNGTVKSVAKVMKDIQDAATSAIDGLEESASVSAIAAADAAAASESARDAAVGAGGLPSYASVALGEAATSTDDLFRVVDPTTGMTTLHIRTIGGSDELAGPYYDARKVSFSISRNLSEAIDEDRQAVNVLRHIPYAQHARIHDGIAPTIDIESYLQEAIEEALSKRTGMTPGAFAGNNPSGMPQYGASSLLFPKGLYPVEHGFAEITQGFGLSFRGEGAYQSTIEVHADDQDVWTLNAYNHLLFQGLTVRHVAQSADPADWTGNLFTLNGVGGGRQLKGFDCAFLGFNIGVLYPDGNVVNNDTVQMRGCDWFWQNKLMRARNAQALINEWSTCSIYGHGDGFDLAGVGYTAFRSLNVVINGTLLNIHGESGLGGSSNQYLLENVKQEPYAIGIPGGLSRSAIIGVSGDLSLVKASVKLTNVGFTSSVNFDPAYPQVELTSNMRIDWDGGNLKPSARIDTHPTNRINNAVFNGAAGLFMKNLLEAPNAGQIIRGSAATGQQTYPAVVYEGNDIVPSMFCGVKAGETSTWGPLDMASTRKRQAMGHGSVRYGLLTAGAAATQSILFHGFMQSIDDLEIHLREKGAAELVVEISTDNFATTVQTIYIGGGATAQPRVVKASDPYVGSKAFDWGSLNTGATQSTTVTVRGAAVGDRVEVTMSQVLGGTRIWGEVTAPHTVTVYHENNTGAPVDVASGTLTAVVIPDRSRCVCGLRASTGLYVRYGGPLAVGFALADYTGR